MRRSGTLAAVVALAVTAPAGAAPQLVTIETPSVNVDPATTVFNGDPPKVLKANVLLPDGWTAARAYPVLFLLHGVGDNYGDWAKPEKGDIARTAAGLNAIVVMPEGGRGFYTNWFNGGKRGAPGWERFYLDELIPEVRRRFRIAAGRRSHAIAGLSMGGFGSAYLGGQRPDFFGTVSVFSGFVEHQRPEVGAGIQAVGGVKYEDIFGPMDGFYASGHNPTKLAANLAHTPVFDAVGNGTPQPGVTSSPSAVLGGGAVEADIRAQNDEFVPALRAAGVDVDYRPQSGVHDWPYWRSYLKAAIAWGLFRPVAEHPTSWTYATTASTGRMWSLRYRFAAPPEGVVTFKRDGGRIGAGGAPGAKVTVTDARSHCGFTAAIPFARALPARTCRVRP